MFIDSIILSRKGTWPIAFRIQAKTESAIAATTPAPIANPKPLITPLTKTCLLLSSLVSFLSIELSEDKIFSDITSF